MKSYVETKMDFVWFGLNSQFSKLLFLKWIDRAVQVLREVSNS